MNNNMVGEIMYGDGHGWVCWKEIKIKNMKIIIKKEIKLI